MQILDGKLVSSIIKEDLKKEVKRLKEIKIIPKLAVILIGDDPASEIYVRNKKIACEYCGIENITFKFKNSVKESEILDLIKNLNSDDLISGILVQLPLPAHIDTKKIINSIDPKKDVDGFHPLNIGKLSLNEDCFVPCTPLGIKKLLEFYKIGLEGKNVCIIGSSLIVGRPLATLLLNENATISLLHIKTKNLLEYTKIADIVIIAIGCANFLKKDMIKKDAIVIDVGINRVDNKIVGDADFNDLKEFCSFITPVPGGVGLMTIAMLLSNTIKAAILNNTKGNK